MKPFARDRFGAEYAEAPDGSVVRRVAGSSVWRFEATGRWHFDHFRGRTKEDPIEFLDEKETR